MEHLPGAAFRRATGNRFVDALPPGDAAEIARFASLWTFAPGSRLVRAGESIANVYFPVSGAVALIEDRAGEPIEIAAAGVDGLAGVELVLGQREAAFTGAATVPLTALVLRAADFLELCEESAFCRAFALRFAAALLRLAGLSAACARHDAVDARLARWLLQLHDHAGPVDLMVTHRLAADMLDVERAAVTRAYAAFERAGAIQPQRGRLRILDPGALAASACACYGISRAIVDDLYAEIPSADESATA